MVGSRQAWAPRHIRKTLLFLTSAGSSTADTKVTWKLLCDLTQTMVPKGGASGQQGGAYALPLSIMVPLATPRLSPLRGEEGEYAPSHNHTRTGS